MKKSYAGLVIAIIVMAVFVITALRQQEALMNPSEAKDEIRKILSSRMNEIQTREQFNAVRAEAALQILPKVQDDNLEPAEELDYADVLSWAGREEESTAILEKLAKGNDITARNACTRIMDQLVEKDNAGELEQMIARYRERFKPTPAHQAHLYGQVSWLAYHYSEKGEYEKAAEVIAQELRSLPFDAPYNSFNLLAYNYPTFIEAGKKAECIEMLTTYKAKFEEIAGARAESAPTDESAKKKFDRETQQYERIARTLGSAYTQIDLVGKPAPDFNLSNFYNTDPVTLADLRGKVVMVDFWANWCGPCKAAFPSMRELYDKYRPEGFIILGVTSFQGSFSDGDIRLRNIDEEKELKLTEDFITRHKMTWPVAFSDRSVFDPQYGVTGIPTFAVVDKKGIVRMIQVGSGETSEKKLKEIVPKLLAEE